MRQFLPYLLVLALLCGFLAATGWVLRARAITGKGMPAFSTYSDGPDGLGELVHVLRSAGYQPTAGTRPTTSAGYEGLLVIVEPQAAGTLETLPLSQSVAERLLKWVEDGNTLLLASSSPTTIHQILHVGVAAGAPGVAQTLTEVQHIGNSPYLEDVQHLSVSGENRLTLPAGAGELWRVKDNLGAAVIHRGKGRIILVADPGLLTRRGLVRADGDPRDDNVVFLVNVVRLHARDRHVLFDEYHHGFRAGTGFWSYLGYYDRRWAILPIVIVVLIMAWRVAVRLGPAVPRREPVRADAVAYASALARLYQKAHARRLLARIVVRDFLGALTAHLRLRRTALPALILSAWREQDKGESASRLQELLRGVAELRKETPSERNVLRWARAFGEFRAAYTGRAGKRG
jgi:Domain of unknown function (DUF4350)